MSDSWKAQRKAERHQMAQILAETELLRSQTACKILIPKQRNTLFPVLCSYYTLTLLFLLKYTLFTFFCYHREIQSTKNWLCHLLALINKHINKDPNTGKAHKPKSSKWTIIRTCSLKTKRAWKTSSELETISFRFVNRGFGVLIFDGLGKNMEKKYAKRWLEM